MANSDAVIPCSQSAALNRLIFDALSYHRKMVIESQFYPEYVSAGMVVAVMVRVVDLSKHDGVSPRSHRPSLKTRSSVTCLNL